MKKLTLWLFICSTTFGFAQSNSEVQDLSSDEKTVLEECDILSCWGNGVFNESDCNCDCEEGFIGKECDKLEFDNGSSLKFDTYMIDFAELVNPEHVVVIDSIKYIKKRSTMLKYMINIKNLTNNKIRINGKTRSGRGHLRFSAGREISANSEIQVEVVYIPKRAEERLEWITFKDGTEEYKIMVRLRITD